MEQASRLVELDDSLLAEFADLVGDYASAGEQRYAGALDDFATYVARLRSTARGDGLRPGRVPETTYWLLVGGRLVGRVGLRHELTPDLEREGGHIGYDVRPSERGRGYGTLLLKLALEKACERGLGRVLVTCDADNAASARVIERNGGRLAGRAVSAQSGKEVLHYWIAVAPRRPPN